MPLKRIALIILFALCSLSIKAQVYRIDQTVPVTISDRSLALPWVGGLNSGQYSTMDANQDGQEDLVVFDRTASKINVFLNDGANYDYSFEYSRQFPEDLRNWVLLRDYDCDGKKDIFASDPLGIIVYKNISDSEGLKWRVFNDRGNQKALLSMGFSDPVNLQLNTTDIPDISDVDGDGDLDILNFRFTGNATVEFHKNLSMERDGVCDSLQLERQTQAWGDFEQCLCQSIAFQGSACPDLGGRTTHQGGKAILTLDMDNDGDRDVILGEEDCTGLYFLPNTGDAQNPIMQSVSADFPNARDPAQLFSFPAAFSEDVDFDGLKDLLVAPNLSGNIGVGVNFEQSSWFYKNVGTANDPEFELVKKSFLQDEMLEFGENAAPAFFDHDGDGDLDMFVGSLIDVNVGLQSSIRLFENVGSRLAPEFRLADPDYGNIAALGLINIKPDFTDANNDGFVDLVFSATNLNTITTEIICLKNTQPTRLALNGQPQVLFALSEGLSNENFELADIDGDGLKDLLVGRSTGRLEYYKNTGTEEAPSFTLVDDTFYGFEASPFVTHPSVDVADVDGDAALDMLVGDDRGNLLYYADFLSNLDEPLEGQQLLFQQLETNEPDGLSLGTRLIPKVVDLFNEDKPAVVIGTGQGGLNLLRNTGADTQPLTDVNLLIFPNPVVIKNEITVVTRNSTTAFIVSMTGKTVTERMSLRAAENNIIPIQNLADGMYLLVTVDAGGDFKSYRFIVGR